MNLIFKHMMLEDGIKHHLQWALAWNELCAYCWAEEVSVISDDTAKIKLSTPVSCSIECQDQNSFQLCYLLLEEAKGQVCTLASVPWGWWRELSSAQYWDYSSRLHFIAKGMVTPHHAAFLLQCFWWLQAEKIAQGCSLKVSDDACPKSRQSLKAA